MVFERGRVPHVLGAQVTVEHVVRNIRVGRDLALRVLSRHRLLLISPVSVIGFIYMDKKSQVARD